MAGTAVKSMIRKARDTAPKTDQVEVLKSDGASYLDGAVVVPREWVKAENHFRSNYNPDEREGLRESIRQHGILVPLIVRPASPFATQEFVVVKGRRRFFCAEDLKLETLPVIIRNVTPAQARLETAIMVMHTEAVSDIDRGRALVAVMEDMNRELDQWKANANEKGVNLKLDAVSSEKMIQEFTQMPQWILQVLERTKETGRQNAKVTWEDVSARIGLTERRLRELKRVAGTSDSVIEAATTGDKPLSGRVLQEINRPQWGLTERQKTTLARRASAENLGSDQVAAIARQMSGKSTPAAASGNGITVSRRVDILANVKQSVSLLAQAADAVDGTKLSDEYHRELRQELQLLLTHASKIQKGLK